MPSLLSRCGGGGALVPQYGVYFSTTQTVASGAQVAMDFNYSVGDHVLDLTDPFNPTPTSDGVWFIKAALGTSTLGWNAGHQLIANVVAVSALFPVGGEFIGTPNSLGNIISGTANALAPMTTTDYFQILMKNGDTANRDLVCGDICVIRIGAT